MYPNKNRKFFKALLYKSNHDGEQTKSEWIMYSPSIGNIYCFVCVLFGTNTRFGCDGFCDWKHPSRIVEQENSSTHRQSMLIFISRKESLGRVDTKREEQFFSEQQYWNKVKHRVIASVKFLSIRRLAFRSRDELFESLQNGNGYIYQLREIVDYNQK